MVVLLALGGYYGYQYLQARRPAPPLSFVPPTPTPGDLPGLDTGPPPWPSEITALRARLQAIEVPSAPEEVTDLHFHLHVDVFVHGEEAVVPAEVGINAGAGFLASIHTHDESGMVHIESPAGRIYSLGQLFDVWGVRFGAGCLGGQCGGDDGEVRVFVGGEEVTAGDPRLIELALHQEIVVTFGTEDELPDPIPATYSFPLGA